MKDELLQAISNELDRQQNHIELIASENFVSQEVLKISGSILTNKYAEGYPGKRYYGGCQYVDDVENVARETLKKLFNVSYVNVQPHSGSSANMAVYKALLNVGDKVMGMSLDAGGHLTHGHSINFSGLEYHIVSYGVDPITERLNYEEIKKIALEEKPKMLIVGASAYPRAIDFSKFREICDACGAIMMVDMAHIAGLVAAGLHQNPCDYADVVTSTTHKTMRGPRGGIVLTNNEEVAKKIDKIIFPGIQGGPLMHIIGAKAMCFIEALDPSFKEYQGQVIKNAQALSDTFIKEGFKVISDGTDNHLLLVDVKTSVGITGKEAERLLDEIYITCNKNTIPNDTESAFKTSGIRLGSPAMTTRGFKEAEFIKIGHIIVTALRNKDDQDLLKKLKEEVLQLTEQFPLYWGMEI